MIYSASSLGRPLVIFTFLHQLYLPKFVYVVCTFMHVAQQSTIEIFAQGSWWHFPNTNSYLAAIFLWHHRHYSVQSWCFIAHSTTNNERFPGVSSRPDLSMSTRISRLEGCFSHKISKHLCRWAAQQKGYIALCTVLAVTIRRIGCFSNIVSHKYDLLRCRQNVTTSHLPGKSWVTARLVSKNMCTIERFSWFWHHTTYSNQLL